MDPIDAKFMEDHPNNSLMNTGRSSRSNDIGLDVRPSYDIRSTLDVLIEENEQEKVKEELENLKQWKANSNSAANDDPDTVRNVEA